jgi:hypothetical protein
LCLPPSKSGSRAIAPTYPEVVNGPHNRTSRSRALTLDELAQRCHAVQVSDANELEADIWESDEELHAFLADLRASRNLSSS